MFLHCSSASLPSRHISLLQIVPFLALLCLFVLSRAASAATLNVPSQQYATIQSAVNAAGNGDTVLIANGTYTGPGNVDVDFFGKNITVTSQNGAAKTIINCGGNSSANHRGFYIHSGEINAVISNLTIRNGYATSGGGIWIVNSGVAVQNCTITKNSAINGGGVFDTNNNGRMITLTNCTITGNTTQQQYFGGGGGGVCNSIGAGSTIAITNCTITNNIAYPGTVISASGGGIYDFNQGGTIALTNCSITGNYAQYNGGGVYNYYGSYGNGTITLTNCTLTGNTASFGGGISNLDSSSFISIINCTLTSNTAGGGIYTAGGGIYNEGSLTLTNDILYSDIGGEVVIEGGIVAGSEGVNDPDITTTHCDVQGGYVGIGNINADPQFVNTPTDLHLSSGSPCLSAGTRDGAPPSDKDGYRRPNPPSMGAYELDTILLNISAVHMSSSHFLRIETERQFGNQSYKVQIKATINGVPVVSSQTLSSDVDASGNTKDTSPFYIDLEANGVPRFPTNQKFSIAATVLTNNGSTLNSDTEQAVILLPIIVVPGIDPVGGPSSSGGDGTFKGLETNLKQASASLFELDHLLGDGYSLSSDQTNPQLFYPTLYTLVYDRNNATFSQGANALSALATIIKQSTYADSINLVGHSKGCLVSRQYLITLPQPAKVHELIMCQGPHLGSLWAMADKITYGYYNYQNLYPLWPWQQNESIFGMSPFLSPPPFNVELQTLNSQPLPTDTSYEIIWSNSAATPYTITIVRAPKLSTSLTTFVPGDLVVPAFSQRGMIQNPNYPAIPLVRIPAFQSISNQLYEKEINGTHIGGYMDSAEVGMEIFGQLTKDLN